MTHDDALEALADDPARPRLAELCADDNPDREQRDAYRAHVVRLASGERAPTPTAPPYDTSWLPGPCGGCR